MRSKSILLLLICSTQIFAQVKFRAITSITLPNTPYEIAQGDFNNDGLVDFATSNFNGLSNRQVTVLLNTGSGTFTGTNVRSFASATNVLDIAVGDFNEDNQLDVVTCSQSNNNFSLLLGDGSGNLGAPTNITAGDLPQGIAVADLNNDNHLDVVVSCRGTPAQAVIFLGNGNGTFGGANILTVANVWDVAIADFDGDTNPDLAFNIASNAVQVWLGNGTGTTFTLLSTITGLNGTENIVAANLDLDSDIDIVSGGGYALNNGDGTFAARVVLPQSAEEYTTGDVNNDGKTDIITADHNTNYTNMRVFIGDGEGLFTLLGKFEGTILFSGAEIADVNNDSNPDVVGVGSWSGAHAADIYLGDGTGYFSGVTKYPVTADPRALAKGDFNKDGILDLAIAHNTGNFVSIYRGLGGGHFAKNFANVSTGSFASELLTFDYNNDSNLDLITFNYSPPTPSVTILTGVGNGSFSALTTIDVAVNATGIAVADFNNDTFVDIAIAGGADNAVYLLNGTGSGFNAATSVSVTGVVEDIEAADFDGDGNQDIGAAFSGPDNFLALTGDGAGGFTEGTLFSVPGTGVPGNIKIFDFNSDGKPDAAVSGSNTEEYFLTNDGAGSFTKFALPATSGSGVGKDFADMDGDGIKDIVFGGQNSISSETGYLRSFKGNGNGTFATTTQFIKPNTGGIQFITHDFNSDGKTDIASVSFNIYEDYLAVLINDTGASACISPTGTLTSSATVCAGQNVTISVTPSGTAPFTYQWKKGGSDISGATLTTLSFTSVAAPDAGSYTCVITNGCGNFSTTASVLTVLTSLTPPTTTGASSCIASALTLNASGGIDGQYRWYSISTGGTAIVGEINSSYTTPIISVTTTYYVSIDNGTCESTRTPAIATIAPIAKPGVSFDPVIVISSGFNLCEGDLQKLVAPSGFAAYLWSNGEVTEEIVITQSDTYSVVVKDAAGCVSPPSDPLTMIVNPYPEAAITVNNTQLTASLGDSYQWYQNGEFLPDATSQSFDLSFLEHGLYHVQVTDNGCTTTSAAFEYLITDVEKLSSDLKVYPNPITADELIVSSPQDATLKMFDLLGRKVKEATLAKGSPNVMLVHDLQAGNYIIAIQSGNTTKYIRIQKK